MAILPGLQFTIAVDVFNGQITEIDMVAAGMTVIRNDALVSPAVLARLERLPKLEQSVAVGKLSRLPGFKDLAGRVTEGIRARLEYVLEINGVTTDRIVSVKRDAVFVSGPPPARMVLSDGTRFKVKGSYTSFARLGQVEVYAVPRRGLAVIKGIPQEKRHLHDDFTTRMVLDVLFMMERDDMKAAAGTLQRFRREYVSRKLPLGFYRSFDSSSGYVMRCGTQSYLFDGESDVDRDDIEIVHNLRSVVIPLARSIA